MLKHADVWRAIDALARHYGLTPSGLARKAGLDPTTFNKSKRITREGKLRWPSTESVAKILRATGSSIEEFVGFLGDERGGGVSRRLPMIAASAAGAPGRFDDAGRPAGEGWDEVLFPDLGDPHAYAIEIEGDDLRPVYRDGDLIVVSPYSSVRRGDRVVVRTVAGEVVIGLLLRRSARRVELSPVAAEEPERVFENQDVEWVHRILWAGQ